MRQPALVVLAAGASTRLGTPKALVDLGGRSALVRLLEAGAGVRGAPPLVVSGAHHEEIRAAVPDGVEVLENREWRRGRTGSVDLARRARAGYDLLLAPVDVPLVPSEVFAALVQAFLAASAPSLGWLAPASGGPPPKPGHPILVGWELLSRMGDLSPDAPLKLLRGRARPLFTVLVESTAIHDDLDTPEDLERLRAHLRQPPN